MDTKFSETRSDAIRSMLEAQAFASGAAPRVRSPRRLLLAAALVAAGALAGTGVSAAAFALTAPSPDPRAGASGLVEAPPGVTPGQPIISLLGEPVSQQVRGDADLPLPQVPVGATHVRVTVVCLSPGSTTWGFDREGNNPRSECTEADVSSSSAGAWMDFELSPSTTTLFLRGPESVSELVTYQFLNYVPTALGVNDRGETFGSAAHDSGAAPDLVAVIGFSPAGTAVEGYARAADLDAFGPEWPGQPSNPDEALEWQEARDEKYPGGWDIPVYESDGVTRIGTFHIGN